MKFNILSACALLAVTGCATAPQPAPNTLRIPYLAASITADGNLDEDCYRNFAPLTAFSVASVPARTAPPTKAWLFWNEKQFICAFACEDATPAWAPPKTSERDVDGQDRAELFLWNGNENGAYFCIEAAPKNAVHDYQARFYRQFDDTWSPAGGTCRAALTPAGYTVEMVLPKAAMQAMGLKLSPGTRFRLGLFRADYDRYSGEPLWITWIDKGQGSPDFHVAESFGTAQLTRE